MALSNEINQLVANITENQKTIVFNEMDKIVKNLESKAKQFMY